MQSPMTFPELLRTYRKSMGWTQDETAKHWNYSFESISAWERGKRNPSNQEVPRLAHLLDVSSEELAQCINRSRLKTQEGLEAVVSEETRHNWTQSFDMWGEIQGIYRSRTEFNRDFSYPRILENARNILAVGISLNAVTISYNHEKIIHSIVENNTTYQVCFLDPDGRSCAEREQEEGYRPGFLSDLTRLNLQFMETMHNRLRHMGPEFTKQLQVSVYDLPPRFNIYIVDDTLMTVQFYAYGRGEETPLFVLHRQGQNGLFDYYASAAKHVLAQARPLEYK